METTKELLDYDVIIVGAGLSGIGAAYHLQTKCPQLRFKIIEGRASVGGTWDLFKYPGIRSDSDMYTFGFAFNPWPNPQSISKASAIMDYIHGTIDKFNIREKIQLNTKLTQAEWKSESASWTLQLKRSEKDETETLKCRFLLGCTGYYDYEKGYRPDFPNESAFKGSIVHPQFWDTNLDFTNKRVVIIGSGATAVTLLPELAKKASKVTMLQRSPTYMVNLPNNDGIANVLKAILPADTAHSLIRGKNILLNILTYNACRRWPKTMRKYMLSYIKKYLGDKYDERHFSPNYNPWNQRLCVVPDNDFFDALKHDNAAICTDKIKEFTETGISLESGEHLDADIIITATGLVIKLFGGAKMLIDGKVLNTADTHLYRGAMLSGVPNFVLAVGYTNAPWTLKVDLVSHFVTRLLNHMEAKKYKTCVAEFDNTTFKTERLFDFDAGYILRGKGVIPSQGSKRPWKVYEDYIKDFFLIKRGNLTDGYLKYK